MYHVELTIARTAADAAAKVALPHWNQNIVAEIKSDRSPVTVADREAEAAITAVLAEAFPDDGIVGEEGAARASRSGRRWIVDPIDGTRDFVRGNRSWATLIALEENGVLVAAVCSMPALNDVFTATRGGGAFVNGERIAVSNKQRLDEAVVSINGVNHCTEFEWGSRVLEWIAPAWSVRSMGGCLDCMMLARGQVDLWIEPYGAEWDLAPLKLIVEEAGGRFFNFDGGSSIAGGNAIAYTPGLEAAARDLLGSNG